MGVPDHDYLKREVDRVYNSLNQLQQLVGGMGQTTNFTYDANGNLARTIDPRDPAPATPTIYTENLYDALNRVRQTRDAAGNNTTTIWDVFDNPKTVTDPRGLTTTYNYNGFGEVTTLASPDTGTTTYAYDKAGNRTRQTDARGVIVNYTYDALNRLTRVDYPADTDTTMTYDETVTGGPGAKGRLTTMVDAAGTTKYQYDKRGNVIRKDVTLTGVTGSFTTHYAYDGADQPTQVTYPSGMVVKYVRTAGRVTAVKVNLGASDVDVLTDITYEPFGPLKSGTFGNGIALTRTRDLAGRLTDLRHVGALERVYGYDSADNLLTSDDQLHGSDLTYTYDAMSRLTQATGTGGSWPLTTLPKSWAYTYTANGNRTSYTPSPATGYAYGIVHSPPPTGSNRGEVSAAPHFFDDDYDVGGDRTKSNMNSLYQWHAQTYNDHHGLKRYAYVDDNEWEAPERFYVDYAYNGRRERVRRTPGGPLVAEDPAAGGGIETRHYDEDGRLLAQHRSGGAVFEYLYLDGEPIAFVRSAGTYGGGTKTLYYYHTDHLGTPRRATDQARAVKWFSVEPYDPFDMLAVSYILGPGMTFPALRFAGQSTDEMTPYFYNYYRDYDPFKGTYLQSDPIGLAGGINTYAYASNSPARFIDRDGRDPEEYRDAYDATGLGGMYYGYGAKGDAEDAMSRAGLPGPHNGPADAYRHCVWSCLMTRSLGVSAASTIGHIHELGGRRTGQKASEEWMDRANNSIGQLCGTQPDDYKSCPEKCMEEYKKCNLAGEFHYFCP